MNVRPRDEIEFLRDSAPVLEGLRLGEIGVWRWRIDTDQLEWTENLEQVHDLPRGSFDGTLASFQRDIHPDDVDAVWRSIELTVATGHPYRAVYRTAPRPDKPPLWIETSGGIITAADGTRFLTGICIDVTDRVRNELELKRRLRQQQAIERCGSFALGQTDFQITLQRATETAADVLDVPLAKVLRFSDSADKLLLAAGVGWREGLVGTATVGIDQESQAGFTLMQGSPVIVADLATETRFSGPPLLHEHHVRSGMSVVIPGSETRPFGVLGIHTTERRTFDQADLDFLVSIANIIANSARHHAAEAQRSLLVREMAHRAGNMLQLVSTIANQTFGSGQDLIAARRSFNQRLGSLSRANHLVARGGWTSTRFIAVLEETLQPFRERLTLHGRDVLLPPELCFDLGLILHELATNSAKYGTLGAGEGQIAIDWTLADDGGRAEIFSFSWKDPARAPETSKISSGFGSKLLTALIERKWHGSIEVDTSAGYRFTCRLPIAR
jgi:two-component sensor histidine kinase